MHRERVSYDMHRWVTFIAGVELAIDICLNMNSLRHITDALPLRHYGPQYL